MQRMYIFQCFWWVPHSFSMPIRSSHLGHAVPSLQCLARCTGVVVEMENETIQHCISIMYTPSLNHQQAIILQGLLTFRPHMQHLPTTRVYRVYRLGWNCTESVLKIFGLWTKLTHPSVHTKLVMEFHLPNWYSSILYIYVLYIMYFMGFHPSPRFVPDRSLVNPRSHQRSHPRCLPPSFRGGRKDRSVSHDVLGGGMKYEEYVTYRDIMITHVYI